MAHLEHTRYTPGCSIPVLSKRLDSVSAASVPPIRCKRMKEEKAKSERERGVTWWCTLHHFIAALPPYWHLDYRTLRASLSLLQPTHYAMEVLAKFFTMRQWPEVILATLALTEPIITVASTVSECAHES